VNWTLRDNRYISALFMDRLFAKAPPRATRVEHALLLLRLSMGVYFLMAGQQKYETPHFDMVMAGMLDHWASTNPLFWYKDILEVIILPNAGFFAALVTWSELLIGASLILGLLVQLSLPLALFLNINFLLATQHTGPAALGINLAFLAVTVALYWSQAGQYFGLDQLIFKSQGGLFSRRAAHARPRSSSRLSLKPKLKPKRRKTDRPTPLRKPSLLAQTAGGKGRSNSPKLTVVPSKPSWREQADLDDDDDDED
jgi:uncharacterized membrane protein YphA (DoxX/SURF4 family)